MKKQVSSILQELSKTIHQYWNIGPEAGQFLNLLIEELNCKNALEIGTSNGYSGIWIAEALAKTKGHLYTIESHKKERFGLATANFQKSGLSKFITQILGHAPEAIPAKPKFFNLILLDATKYEYPDYLKAILPRTKKNSVIIADNLATHREQLQPYIKKIRALKTFQTFELNIGNGLLLSIRTD